MAPCGRLSLEASSSSSARVGSLPNGKSISSYAVLSVGAIGLSDDCSAASTPSANSLAVLIHELDAAARQRVLVAAAARNEQRDRARMPPLQFVLRRARPIGGNEIIAEHRGVASISGHDGPQLAVLATNGKHGSS